ncbi:MAG: GDP-mannose 4,6-dehydratase [Elusimicrobiota bacterium]|nr:GDP-mannose 4,6-dehydratase [Elusimicrobiota bacterium]
MARVLLTGAGGFLAGPLAQRLRGRRPFLSRHRDLDLSDAASARALVRDARPSLVFHLAGRTRPGSWEDYWKSHATATVNLLEALSSEGRPVKVVLVGSAAEYGAAGGRRVVREDAPLEPLSLYGASKLAQTLAALSYNRGPVSVVVARLFNVLGPGTPDNLAPGAFARQVAAIEAGRQPPELLVGDLSPRRDYLDARDAAEALLALGARGRGGECYNVGAGRSTSMRAVLDGLLAASTAAVAVRVDPARLRKAEVQDLAADARKLRRETGWRPRFTLARSLADTLDWWRGR